jgi:hypothetical protein
VNPVRYESFTDISSDPGCPLYTSNADMLNIGILSASCHEETCPSII